TNPALVRVTLNRVSQKLQADTGKPLAEVYAAERTKFGTKPEESLVAQGVVLARLIAAAADSAKASTAEKKLLEAFTKYVIGKRTYIAKDMLAAYDNWYASDVYWRGQKHLGQGLSGTFYYGTVPPSFDKLGMATTVGIYATTTAT